MRDMSRDELVDALELSIRAAIRQSGVAGDREAVDEVMRRIARKR